MLPKHFTKTLVLMGTLVLIFIASLEYYWRSRGFKPSYNDDKVLWTKNRKEAYKKADQATFFIGGSRIKFDLDVATWEAMTGEKAIQLALVGTPARPVLLDLANDSTFRGKLIIDVAEAQFFTLDSIRRERSAREAIEYYKKETPAQKVGASINYLLESKFVFLEEGKFGLTTLLNDLQIPNRTGVISPFPFPKELVITSFARQNSMTPMFLADPRLIKRQKDIWTNGIANGRKIPVINGDTLTTFFKMIKTYIDKIRARGGLVVFVRPPSGELYIQNENRRYPRKQYWDQLLAYTNTPGIYFSDYPETANFICPEMSHLAPKDAVIYTKSLVKTLQEEKGWTFSRRYTEAKAD